MKIILLDLNYTLVSNSPPRGTVPDRMPKRLLSERYRLWLIRRLSGHRVILITARPDRWKVPTLERIEALTGWRPDEAFFDEGIVRTPPLIKKHILLHRIFPAHGNENLLAIESNPKTRSMYATFNIPCKWVSPSGRRLVDH